VFDKYRLVDLSLEYYEGMFTYPADLHVRTELTIMGRHFLEGRAATKMLRYIRSRAECRLSKSL
jgi:hypothetical protein